MSNFLNLENGKPLMGVHVSDIKFQGVSTLDQLEDYGLSRPSRLEHTKVRERQEDKKLSIAYEVRESIQRRMNAERIARAEAYALYLHSVEVLKRMGGAPPITLFLPKSHCLPDRLIVPYGAVMLAVDGETQTEARFKLRDRYPETGMLPVAVSVYHDCGDDVAKQILHDYNRFANPVKEKELMTINPAGPLNQAAVDAIRLAEIPEEQVDRHRSRPAKKRAISQIQVMYAIAGFAFGEDALHKSADGWLDSLNNPVMDQTLKAHDGACTASVSQLARAAMCVPDSRTADPLVWQVAGAMLSQGRSPESIKWGPAIAAYRQGGKSVHRKLDLMAAAI